MKVITLNNMLQLDKIDGSELLLARKGDKDYALPVSSIVKNNKNSLTLQDGNFSYSIVNSNGNLFLKDGYNSKIGDFVINEQSFNDNNLLSFENAFCPGIYRAWKQGYNTDANAEINFNITFPSFIDIKTNNNNLFLNNLTIRIRTSYGAAVLVLGHSYNEATYMNISENDASIIQNKNITNDFINAFLSKSITDIRVCKPNQLRIRLSLYNNLRYINPVTDEENNWNYEIPTASNTNNQLVQPNTTCTITASGSIGYASSN